MTLISNPEEKGFSLLEILVAFAILSLSIGILLRIFAGGGHIARTADDYYRAVITAESLMTSVGQEKPLAPGISHGSTETGFRWTLTITPFPFNPQPLGNLPDLSQQKSNAGGYQPFWVTLEVEWGPEEDPRAFTLESLRLLQEKPSGIM